MRSARTSASVITLLLVLGACTSTTGSSSDSVSQPEGEIDQSGGDSNADVEMIQACGLGFPVTGRSLRIVSTVSPVTNLAATLVSGTGLKVTGIIPDGIDASTYIPTAADNAAFAKADIVYANGLGLDDEAVAAARKAVAKGTIVCEAGTASLSSTAYIYDDNFPKESGAPNPYVWPVPSVALRTLNALRSALYARLSVETPAIEKNYVTLSSLIMSVQTAMETATETVPVRNRKIVSADPALSYFARHFGYDVVTVPYVDGSNSSPEVDDALVEAVKSEKVPAVFGSWQIPAALKERLRKDAGAEWVVTDEVFRLPGRADTTEHSWAGAVVSLSVKIVESLGGDASALKAVKIDIGLDDTAVYPAG